GLSGNLPLAQSIPGHDPKRVSCRRGLPFVIDETCGALVACGMSRDDAAQGAILENLMTASEMPADRFWQIIERAGESDHEPDAHLEALRTALRELTLAE